MSVSFQFSIVGFCDSRNLHKYYTIVIIGVAEHEQSPSCYKSRLLVDLLNKEEPGADLDERGESVC